MRSGLAIRTDIEVRELHRHARLEADGHMAGRLLAIANALPCMSRQAAAEAAGMDCRALGDWVHRLNADGIVGFGEVQQAVLEAMFLRGPDLKADGVSA